MILGLTIFGFLALAPQQPASRDLAAGSAAGQEVALPLLLEPTRSATDEELRQLVERVPEEQAACRALRVYTDRLPRGQEGREASEIELEFNRLRAAALLAEATFCVGPYLSRP